MTRPHAVVLVDTNVIMETHRTGAWAALAGTYGVETVEDCMIETQTGYHRRTHEQLIDAPDLRASLTAVHDVTDSERAELAVRISDIALDRGEESPVGACAGASGYVVTFRPGSGESSRGSPAWIARAIGVAGRTSRKGRTQSKARIEAGVHEEVDDPGGQLDGCCRIRGTVVSVRMQGVGDWRTCRQGREHPLELTSVST